MSYPNDDLVKDVASWQYKSITSCSGRAEIYLPIHFDDIRDELDPVWVDSEWLTDPKSLVLNMMGPEPKINTLMQFLQSQYPLDEDEINEILSDLAEY